MTTLGVLVAANMIDGIWYDRPEALIVASLMLGLLNTFLRPILIIFSLPLLIFTLGLFTFVINAGLLYLVSTLVTTFHVATFGAALKGSLVISLVSMITNLLFGSPKAQVKTSAPPRDAGGGPTSGGPGNVIDV